MGEDIQCYYLKHDIMKLEYMHDLTANGKFINVVSENLIRLWDFNQAESKLFHELIQNFAKNDLVDQLELHNEEFIIPINCHLTLIKDKDNVGISRISNNEFHCKVTTEEYRNMAEYIKPFILADTSGYQWLLEQVTDDNIDLLFSPGGTW